MLKVVKEYSIYSKSGGMALLNSEQVRLAIDLTNYKLRQLKERTENDALNIFDALDFRMMSGMVGEALITVIDKSHNNLMKNPHIDGYPDLLDVNTSQKLDHFNSLHTVDTSRERFNNFQFGGIEIKNTFGVKKPKTQLEKGETRIHKISKKLDWKAHHTSTNHLLGLFSDFIDGTPQIVAAFYCDQLNSDDWKKKQNPKEGSAMTSFSVIDRSGWLKMKSNLIVCIDDDRYLNFFKD